MPSLRSPVSLAVLGVGLTGMLFANVSSKFHSAYPPFGASLQTPQASLKDAGGIVLGMRRMAADLAWVYALQYYGTPEPGQSESDFENGIGKYPEFFALCKRVAGLDPYFTYVYYYGGAVLGWNLNRLSEAEELIRLGISNNPREWRLPIYLAALAYQKNHDVANLVRYLSSIVDDPQCPQMMKALLANLYKKQGSYNQALALWEGIYASGDPGYKQRAMTQIIEIQALRGSRRALTK